MLELNYKLYPLDDDTPEQMLIEYIVAGKVTGGQDLFVAQEVVNTEGETTWSNRVSWEGRGKDKKGYVRVRAWRGSNITAYVYEGSPPYTPVSNVLTFTVPS